MSWNVLEWPEVMKETRPTLWKVAEIGELKPWIESAEVYREGLAVTTGAGGIKPPRAA
jgi:hypothetical protein